MNRFEFLRPIDDLGFTVIENAFINHYMPKARGDYVKVYLYGFKACGCGCGNYSPSNAEIANALKMTESDVVNAWKYWDSEGILHYVEQENDSLIEYLSVSSKLLIPSAEKKPKIRSKQGAPNAKIRQMNRDIEEKLGRPLTVNELNLFQEWIEKYQFTPQTVVLLISDCADRDRRTTAYWQNMAKVFFDAGIRTYDQAQQYLKSRDARWSRYSEILNYLGFYRLPTKPEQTMIDRWIEEYQLDMQAIKAACDETVKTGKPSLKYVDTILSGGRAERSARNEKRPGRNNKMDHEQNYDVDLIEQALFGRREASGEE